MKKTVYLDTSIPSYYFDERESVKFQSEITQKWFKEEANSFEIYLSEATLGELNSGDYPNKTKIMYTDPILAEKERIQKELCRKADYDIHKLFENIHKNVAELSKKTNTVLKYSKRRGGYVNIRNDALLQNNEHNKSLHRTAQRQT